MPGNQDLFLKGFFKRIVERAFLAPDDLESRQKASLLAEFVGCDSVQAFVPFYRNDPGAVRIYGMIPTFPEQPETIFFQVANQITSVDRHARPLWGSAR